MKAPPEIEVLAVFVHGSLAALHALGAVYNLRLGRGNRLDALAHLCAAGYDAAAAIRHARKAAVLRPEVAADP
jgi:hypothetical protein